MTDKITATIRSKFIENLDEGLLLREDLGNLQLSEGEKDFFKRVQLSKDNGEEIPVPDKPTPLITLFLKEREVEKAGDILNKAIKDGIAQKHYLSQAINSCMYKIHRKATYNENFPEDYLQTEANSYWGKQAKILNDILNKAPQIISAETISEKDLIFVNVGYRSWVKENPNSYNTKVNDTFYVYNNGREYFFIKKADTRKIAGTFADVFIFTPKYFIKISLGPDGVIDRSEHIIQKDIKRVNITDNNLFEIYFHGYFDPETIVLDDYKSALQLQRYLTELRQVRLDNRYSQGQKK